MGLMSRMTTVVKVKLNKLVGAADAWADAETRSRVVATVAS